MGTDSKTPMQQMVDWMERRPLTTHTSALQKAKELVQAEKEQRATDHMTGFAAQIRFEHAMDYRIYLQKQFDLDE